MAKSIIAFLLVALVLSAAVQSVSADKTARKLLATQQNGCGSPPPQGGFFITIVITGTFWNHNSWLGNYQCCNGQWVNGGCHAGNCYWKGVTYSNWSWENGANWQCCSGSWVQYGCKHHSQSNNDCYYNGNKFSPYSWWQGEQCCNGVFRSGGCSGRN
jgi:hypothetical protein